MEICPRELHQVMNRLYRAQYMMCTIVKHDSSKITRKTMTVSCLTFCCAGFNNSVLEGDFGGMGCCMGERKKGCCFKGGLPPNYKRHDYQTSPQWSPNFGTVVFAALLHLSSPPLSFSSGYVLGVASD